MLFVSVPPHLWALYSWRPVPCFLEQLQPNTLPCHYPFAVAPPGWAVPSPFARLHGCMLQTVRTKTHKDMLNLLNGLHREEIVLMWMCSGGEAFISLLTIWVNDLSSHIWVYANKRECAHLCVCVCLDTKTYLPVTGWQVLQGTSGALQSGRIWALSQQRQVRLNHWRVPQHLCSFGRLGEARDWPHTIPLINKQQVRCW